MNILTTLPAFTPSSMVPAVDGEHIDIWAKRARATKASNGDAPLWSGKGAPPAVGTYVDIKGKGAEVATVLGYVVEGDWLMLWCERHSDGRRGDLAGTELRED